MTDYNGRPARPGHRLRLFLMPALFVLIAALHFAFLGFDELWRIGRTAIGLGIAWLLINLDLF